MAEGQEGQLQQLARQPEVQRFLNAVLDQRDRRGVFPRTLTYPCEGGTRRLLERLFPAAALRPAGAGRLTVHLDRLRELEARAAADRGEPPPDLEARFDRLTGRRPRNLAGDREAWRCAVLEHLEAGLAEGAARAGRAGRVAEGPAVEALCASLREPTAAGRGPWLKLSRDEGLDAVREGAARLLAGFVLARDPDRDPTRLGRLHIDMRHAGSICNNGREVGAPIHFLGPKIMSQRRTASMDGGQGLAVVLIGMV